MDVVTLSEEATLGRFNAQQDRVARDMGYGDTKGALGLSKDAVGPLGQYLRTKFQTYKEELEPRTDEFRFLASVDALDADVVALAALNAALHAVAQGEAMTTTYDLIGAAVNAEYWAFKLREHDKVSFGLQY
jgi:hypothetical protein